MKRRSFIVTSVFGSIAALLGFNSQSVLVSPSKYYQATTTYYKDIGRKDVMFEAYVAEDGSITIHPLKSSEVYPDTFKPEKWVSFLDIEMEKSCK